MTGEGGTGRMLLVNRQTGNKFAACFLGWAGFTEFSGARSPNIGERLAAAFQIELGDIGIKSLRRDSHQKEELCWLHEENWCLSYRSSGNG
jgi:protein-L-isoaspartate(D-aspartate) O-methyltransferase